MTESSTDLAARGLCSSSTASTISAKAASTSTGRPNVGLPTASTCRNFSAPPSPVPTRVARMAAEKDRSYHGPMIQTLDLHMNPTEPRKRPASVMRVRCRDGNIEARDDARRTKEPFITTDVGRGRHARSRSRPQQLSLHSLPAFEIHPSASSSATTQGRSLAQSPTKMTSSPAPPSGHRRNGSGFIGGETKSGGLGLISTSPTTGEGTLPQPSTSRTGTPVNRRGHSHRQSGAISSHDLSMILNPPDEPRNSSAPTPLSNPSTESSFRRTSRE
ncbi:hypothetical protein MMC07_000051 [Pseudocyphellaria aurata]|nr:hypothetical protein [Pseudocyphellaria aurata]